MAGIAYKGLRAYEQDLLSSDQASLNEPNQLIDELMEASEKQGRPVQEKETLKHLIGTDIRHQMPPQMYAIVASLAKLIDTLDQIDEGDNSHE